MQNTKHWTEALWARWLNPKHVFPAGSGNWLRAACGIFIGLMITGFVSIYFLEDSPKLPFLLASMGATAVLLFLTPTSTMARPWPVLGGNMVSALIGILVGSYIDHPVWAASIAVSLALLAMIALRCLHTPGGGLAALAILGHPIIVETGWSFAFIPVGLNAIILLGVAWAFNGALRLRPFALPKRDDHLRATGDPTPFERTSITSQDIEDVLSRYHSFLDVSTENLADLFQQVEARVGRRLLGEMTCAAVMSKDVIKAHQEEALSTVMKRLVAHKLDSLPIVDRANRYMGMVGAKAIVEYYLGQEGDALKSYVRQQAITDVLLDKGIVAKPDTPLEIVFSKLSNGQYHEIAIVDDTGHLAGFITRTDLLATLWRGYVAEHV